MPHRIASAAAETQEQALHETAHHQSAQQKVKKDSTGRPKTQERSGYSQGNPEASAALVLKAQQKVAELSQQLTCETKVSKCVGLSQSSS